MICPETGETCEGPAPGGWWTCPVHGARLTEGWTTLCRTKEKYRAKWKDGHGPGQSVGPTKSPGPKRPRLGGAVARALQAVGLDRNWAVEAVQMGTTCQQRHRLLRRIEAWAEKEYPDRDAALAALEEALE